MMIKIVTCAGCGVRFKKNINRRARKYCKDCRNPIRVQCPGCGKEMSMSSVNEHAKLCPSSITSEEIRDVIRATEDAKRILRKNDWTLNKPIEQLNKEYYNNGKTD